MSVSTPKAMPKKTSDRIIEFFKWIIENKWTAVNPSRISTLIDEYTTDVKTLNCLRNNITIFLRSSEFLDGYTDFEKVHISFMLGRGVTEELENLLKTVGSFQLDGKRRITQFKSFDETFERNGTHFWRRSSVSGPGIADDTLEDQNDQDETLADQTLVDVDDKPLTEQPQKIEPLVDQKPDSFYNPNIHPEYFEPYQEILVEAANQDVPVEGPGNIEIEAPNLQSGNADQKQNRKAVVKQEAPEIDQSSIIGPETRNEPMATDQTSTIGMDSHLTGPVSNQETPQKRHLIHHEPTRQPEKPSTSLKRAIDTNQPLDKRVKLNPLSSSIKEAETSQGPAPKPNKTHNLKLEPEAENQVLNPTTEGSEDGGSKTIGAVKILQNLKIFLSVLQLPSLDALNAKILSELQNPARQDTNILEKDFMEDVRSSLRIVYRGASNQFPESKPDLLIYSEILRSFLWFFLTMGIQEENEAVVQLKSEIAKSSADKKIPIEKVMSSLNTIFDAATPNN